MDGSKPSGTRQGMRFALALVTAFALAVSLGAQQTPAKQPQQSAPPAPASGGNNPFPEDTTSVPLMPTTAAGLNAAGTGNDAPSANVELPAAESDPVHSPDDVAALDDAGPAQGFSSSHSGLDSVLPDPNAPDPRAKGRRGKKDEPPPHVETAKEDVTVGKYYLDNKNWKAAVSRFQSAMVLSPEDPEVYWGLAESQRHLGDFASAKANYLRVVEYDPGSKHAKEAEKALKEPEMARAK